MDLMAQVNRLSEMGRNFRGERSQLGLDDIVKGLAVLAVVFGVAWLLNRYLLRKGGERIRYTSPRRLFGELCRAHGLSWPQRRLLRKLAMERKLPQPSELFLMPQAFAEAGLSPALAARSSELQALNRRLFEASQGSSG